MYLFCPPLSFHNIYLIKIFFTVFHKQILTCLHIYSIYRMAAPIKQILVHVFCMCDSVNHFSFTLRKRQRRLRSYNIVFSRDCQPHLPFVFCFCFLAKQNSHASSLFFLILWLLPSKTQRSRDSISFVLSKLAWTCDCATCVVSFHLAIETKRCMYMHGICAYSKKRGKLTKTMQGECVCLFVCVQLCGLVLVCNWMQWTVSAFTWAANLHLGLIDNRAMQNRHIFIL